MVEGFVAIVRRFIFRVLELLCRRFHVGLAWNPRHVSLSL